VTVVGGGLAGLTAARELAGRADVTLVERLPAAGGVWGFEHPRIRALVADCRDRGVELVLGATALRWRDHRLLIVGPGQTQWLSASHLVFAGGTRPAHAAELRVAGGRLAGVFVATVAHHLLDAGIRLGRRHVVAGWGDWAELIVPQLQRHGQVTVVGGNPGDRLPWRDVDWWPGYRPASLRGGSRVSQVEVTNGHSGLTVGCDCVVFAGDPRPLRNVDGANVDGVGDVTFIQPTAPGLGAEAVIEFAQAVAAAVPLSPEGLM
jgi:D-hydroxyproline dehydrogenase subunit alpha